ncbi:unnamed protein product [Dimorphilus gyrociliatus]|uniref:Myb-like domain-containing protein n=1 Tax=Dimorphilus gyrociliatus TaxID=2664684 RepID=A0A7I8VW54_9ANNE|nr:unnamed protein product [Dimorphilus gyrociliatus]
MRRPKIRFKPNVTIKKDETTQNTEVTVEDEKSVESKIISETEVSEENKAIESVNTATDYPSNIAAEEIVEISDLGAKEASKSDSKVTDTPKPRAQKRKQAGSHSSHDKVKKDKKKTNKSEKNRRKSYDDELPILTKKDLTKSVRPMVSKKLTRKTEYLHTPVESSMKISDLIYLNPTTNPMPKDDSEVVQEFDEKPDKPAVEEDLTEESSSSAPQIRIDEKGEIVIDEESLVVREKKKFDFKSMPLTDGNKDEFVSSRSFKKQSFSGPWTVRDTATFYLGLKTLGTDFTSLTKLFPGRSREELKKKFKREERVNGNLVETALMNRHSFDMSIFDEEKGLATLSNKDLKRINQKYNKQKNISRSKTKEPVSETVSETVNEISRTSHT